MNDCTRIAPLLEVYADHEASAETNALVLDHLQRCDRCAREFRDSVALREQLRETLGAGRASPHLRERILAATDRGRPAVWGRAWLAKLLLPASAAVIALAIWLARAPAVDAYVDQAVDEHVVCALRGQGPRLADTAAAERGLSPAMPWIRSGADGLRIVEAHTCGGDRPFSHMVLDVEGSTASILIGARDPTRAGLPPSAFTTRGEFEVNVLTTAKHVAYVIVDRHAGDRSRVLRAATLQRVERFLQQLEGRS